MSIRRIALATLGVATLSLAACSSGTSSSPAASAPDVAPTPAASVGPASLAPATMSPAASPAASTGAVTGTSGLAGFCADVASGIAASWPNVDASTATTLATKVSAWAGDPELTDLRPDVVVIAAWVPTLVSAPASPPPAVVTAFDHIKAFADSHC